LIADRLVLDYPGTWAEVPAHAVTTMSAVVGVIANLRAVECAPDCDPNAIRLPPGGAIVTISMQWSPAPFEGEIAPSDGVQVAGFPASFLRTTGDRNSADEVDVWTFAAPEEVGASFEIRARLRGPGLDALRDEVARILASARLEPPVPSVAELDEAAPEIARAVLESLATRSSAYRCFPLIPGVSGDTIVESPDRTALARPLEVTCRTAWTSHSNGLLEMALVMAWGADGGHAAGEREITVWARSDGSIARVRSGGDTVPGTPGSE
jgi:hypothetical protein